MTPTNASFVLGPKNAAKACLLIHDVNGSPAELLDLGKALVAQGVRVYGIAPAGHSGDPEALLRSGHKPIFIGCPQPKKV